MGVLRLSCLLQLLLSCSFFFLLSFSRKKYCLSSLLVSLLVTQPICCTLQTFLMRITIFLLPGIFKLSFLQSSFPTSEMSFLSTWLMIHHLHCKCKNSGGFCLVFTRVFCFCQKLPHKQQGKHVQKTPYVWPFSAKFAKNRRVYLLELDSKHHQEHTFFYGCTKTMCKMPLWKMHLMCLAARALSRRVRTSTNFR